jgi:hypothetical protein
VLSTFGLLFPSLNACAVVQTFSASPASLLGFPGIVLGSSTITASHPALHLTPPESGQFLTGQSAPPPPHLVETNSMKIRRSAMTSCPGPPTVFELSEGRSVTPASFPDPAALCFKPHLLDECLRRPCACLIHRQYASLVCPPLVSPLTGRRRWCGGGSWRGL